MRKLWKINAVCKWGPSLNYTEYSNFFVNKITPCWRAVFEKLRVARLNEKFSSLLESEHSALLSDDAATIPCSESDEFGPHNHILLIEDHF